MKIGFGILGCGYIGRRHAKHISEHPEGTVVAGFDIKEDRMLEFCNDFHAKKCSSLDELLSNPEVDLISVCTPNGLHYQGAISALKAGKHVLVEKPMALSKTQCEEMIKESEKNKKELYVVKQNRFNPPIVKLKEIVESGKLGQVYMVQVNCFWNRNEKYYLSSDWKGTKELDGGTLFTQFSHFVDILYYLFGNLENISGIAKNVNHGKLIEFEDTGTFNFYMKNGALGSLIYTSSCYMQNMEGSITVWAENATIKIGGKYLNTIEYQKTNDFDITDVEESRPANNYGYYEGSMSNHDRVINNVIDALSGRGKIMTNAYEGMDVVDIIERMYHSIRP